MVVAEEFGGRDVVVVHQHTVECRVIGTDIEGECHAAHLQGILPQRIFLRKDIIGVEPQGVAGAVLVVYHELHVEIVACADAEVVIFPPSQQERSFACFAFLLAEVGVVTAIVAG